MNPRMIVVDTRRLMRNRERDVLKREPVFWLGRTTKGSTIYAECVPLTCGHCGSAVATLRAEKGVVVVVERAE